MSEDTMSPVTAAEPPSPLGEKATASSTIRLKPVIRKPIPGGAASTQNGLRPGLKLPPKPGLKTGGTQLLKPGLRPGLKLPTQTALKKPSPTVAATPVATPAPAPAPATPAPGTVDSLEQLKTITQSMKSITAPIPQQAILRRTGIIADQDLTEAQKMAAKARTSRISLSDAIGVETPSAEGAAPMKTIRIKRPADIPGATVSLPAQPHPAAPAEGAEPAAEASSTITQRKTLKIARPQGGVKPQGKFAVRKPGAAASAPAPAPAPADAEVADIPDLPAVPAAASAAAPAGGVPDVPKGVAVSGIVFQLAACAVIGVLGWWLYNDFNLPHYCGGCMP